MTQSLSLRFENLGRQGEARQANERLQRDTAKRIQTERERDALIADLQRAKNGIPVLQGILPVCSSCRKKPLDEVQDKKTEYSQCTPAVRTDPLRSGGRAPALISYRSEEIDTMNIAEKIKEALDKKGYKNLKEASKMLGISPELLRVTINKGHIPKDNTLMMIAKKLDIEMSALVLAAHQEKVPNDVKGYFLTPSDTKLNRGKRKYPLSEEQTSYLAQVLSADEIAMLRTFRQISEEGRMQIAGFIDFTYGTKKKE